MEVDFFEKHKTKEDLIKFLEDNQDNELYKKVLIDYKYEKELKLLQSELVLLQQWVQREEKKSPYYLKEEMLLEKAAQ